MSCLVSFDRDKWEIIARKLSEREAPLDSRLLEIGERISHFIFNEIVNREGRITLKIPCDAAQAIRTAEIIVERTREHRLVDTRPGEQPWR